MTVAESKRKLKAGEESLARLAGEEVTISSDVCGRCSSVETSLQGRK